MSSISYELLDARFKTDLLKNEKLQSICDPCGLNSHIDQLIKKHLKEIVNAIPRIDRMFDAPKGKERMNASREFLQYRRKLGIELFTEGIQCEIEFLLQKYEKNKSFNESCCVIGFNRLFTREVASAGTDIDFMLLTSVENSQFLEELRSFIKNEIAQKLEIIGVELEITEHCVLSVKNYLQRIANTTSALFTFANFENMQYIAGSKEIFSCIFFFENSSFLQHFLSMSKTCFSSKFPEQNMSKMPIFRHTNETLRLFRKMACFQIYIGKNPYSGKKTIQTILTETREEDIRNRTAKISIKYCINRISDFAYSTKSFYPQLNIKQVRRIEKLGTILSNIKCRLNSRKSHPLLSLQKGYDELALEDIKRMSNEDNSIIAKLLGRFQFNLNPQAECFSEQCYDALWSMIRRLNDAVKKIENSIYRETFSLIDREMSVC